MSVICPWVFGSIASGAWLSKLKAQKSFLGMSTGKKPPPGSPGLAPGQSGMKIGQSFKFVHKDDMPGLEAHRISQACDNLANATDTYKSLLYLSRAKASDVAAIFEASRSDDVQKRWQRLWVLCPILARLARVDAGKVGIVSDFGKDLAALHMFARFDPSKNIAPKKFFERMKSDLLTELLSVMVSFISDEARSNLVAGIITVVETSGPALEARLVEEYGAEKAAKVMANLLITESTQARQKVLSPQDIRQRLEQLRAQES